MGYLLDANVFMSASRLHYGLDFCPAFWDWLTVMHRSAKLFSVERVADEIAFLGFGAAIHAAPDPGVAILCGNCVAQASSL
jgi:hypothetical protein